MDRYFKIKYGKKEIKNSFPSGKFLGFIEPIIPKIGTTEKSIIENAYKNPINSPKLEEFLNHNDKVLLIIPDKTRICRINLTLPFILKKIESIGITKNRIKIIFATGSHSVQTRDEKINLVGKKIFGEYKIYEHNAFDIKNCKFFGKTSFGTDLYLNKIISECNKIITIGTTSHHYFAGFGGGAKMLMPGLAHYSTIMQNHKRAILADGTSNNSCTTANLKDNPIYLDIAETVDFCPPIFSLTVILSEKGKIIDCKCGNILESHKAASLIIDQYYKVDFNKLADLVLVSAGGYPKDINFIQSHKSIHNASFCVKDGGVIISFAECLDGLGSKTFIDWFKFQNEKEFRKNLVENYSLNAQTALSLKEKLKKFSIILISDLDEEIVRSLGIIPAKDFETAINSAKEIIGKFSYYLINNGSITFPNYKKRN